MKNGYFKAIVFITALLISCKKDTSKLIDDSLPFRSEWNVNNHHYIADTVYFEKYGSNNVMITGNGACYSQNDTFYSGFSLSFLDSFPTHGQFSTADPDTPLIYMPCYLWIVEGSTFHYVQGNLNCTAINDTVTQYSITDTADNTQATIYSFAY